MLFQFNHNPVVRRLATTILFASFWLATSFTYAANKGGVPLSEYNALVSLYNATGGPHWVTSDNWLSNQPVASWFGVTVENGKVTRLALSSNNLVGVLLIEDLPLVNLVVDNNQLTGIDELPRSLVTLDVSVNLLKKLPALSQTKLQFLNAASNQLKELPGLPATLTSLVVDFNQISMLPTLPAGLQGLSANNNNLQSLPKLPAGLFNMDVSFNRLQELPALPASLTELLATNNQLGKLPTLPGMLNSLHVDFNQLYSLPKFPASLFSFSCANNHLTFRNLEPIFSIFAFGSQQYAPQDSVGRKENITIPVGGSRTLSADYVGNSPNNRFVWFKDGIAVSDTLTTPFFAITHADASKAGVYACNITNKVVAGLTINRRPITVTVSKGGVSLSEYNALVALYNATGGPHWVTSDNWLSNQPVASWFGVTVENGKVTRLALSSNNLVGTLPTKDLPLVNLIVDNNQLTGIDELPRSLVTLDVSVNLLKKLPSLSQTKLQFLNAASNQLKELPGLPATLTSLVVDFNQISMLPTLPAGLQGLSANNNKLQSLTYLPAGLFNMDVSFNRLQELPALPASLTELLATNNQLGKLPTLPGMLNSLHVDVNQLYNLPKLPLALFSFSCATNHFTFRQLEPIFSVFAFGSQQYAPQKDVGTADSVAIPFGGNHTLSADYVGNSPNNRFVWFKDGVAVSDTLTTPFFAITQADAVKAGVYTCSISNKVVVGLTINRRPITVSVGAKPNIASTAARKGTESVESGELSLKVFPNPFVHSVQLARLDERFGTVAVQVLDGQGRTVHSVAEHTIGEFIQLAHLSNGLYILRVVDGKQVKTFRLVKK